MMIVPASQFAQNRTGALSLISATPAGPAWPVVIVCWSVPSRCAATIVPVFGAEPWSAQNRGWQGAFSVVSTATPFGPSWLVAIVCWLLPSRFAATTVPPSTIKPRLRSGQ